MTWEVTGVWWTSGPRSSRPGSCVQFRGSTALTHTSTSCVSCVFFYVRAKRKSWTHRLTAHPRPFFFLLCVSIAEDVFLMSSKDPKNPVIYAVFTTSRYTGLFTVTSKKKKNLSNSLTDAGGITFVLLLCCCLEIRRRWYIFSERLSCASYFLRIWKTHASYFLSRILPIHILYSPLSVIS